MVLDQIRLLAVLVTIVMSSACMSSENKVVKLSLLLLFAVTASQSSTSPEDLSLTGLQKPLGECKSKLCEFYWSSLIYTRNVTNHHHACLYGNEKQ